MLNCVTNCVTANIYPMAVQISGISNMGFQIKFLVVINQDLSGSNIFHPVFWPQVKYQDVKSNNLEKNYLFSHCSFTQPFYDVEK